MRQPYCSQGRHSFPVKTCLAARAVALRTSPRTTTVAFGCKLRNFLSPRKIYTANVFIESRCDEIDILEDKFNAKIYHKLHFSCILE